MSVGLLRKSKLFCGRKICLGGQARTRAKLCAERPKNCGQLSYNIRGVIYTIYGHRGLTLYILSTGIELHYYAILFSFTK